MIPQPSSQSQNIEWPDHCHFFLTSSTFLHYPYFKEPEQKQIVLKKIKDIKRCLEVRIEAYSIAINHFHLLFYADKGADVTRVKTILHSGISREWNKMENLRHGRSRNFYPARGRGSSESSVTTQKVVPIQRFRPHGGRRKFNWQSTRTLWIKDQDMYWAVQGYIIGNLLKHREVSTFKELFNDSYSSFQYIADKHGFDFACNLVSSVIEIKEDVDGSVELADFGPSTLPVAGGR